MTTTRIAYLRTFWIDHDHCVTVGYDAEGRPVIERPATDAELYRVKHRREPAAKVERARESMAATRQKKATATVFVARMPIGGYEMVAAASTDAEARRAVEKAVRAAFREGRAFDVRQSSGESLWDYYGGGVDALEVGGEAKWL